MKNIITAALAGATALTAAVSADAATFDYRFGFERFGGLVVVSGKLDATDDGAGLYTIDSAGGRFTEEYVEADGSTTVYDSGDVTDVDMTFDDLGPSFRLTNGALTEFNALFRGTNGFSDLSYQVSLSSGTGTGFFVEIGGPLSVASLTPSVPGGVPEPATWALMILGFGAVAGAMRRRRSVTATVRFA
jgi:hypothetical protein